MNYTNTDEEVMEACHEIIYGNDSRNALGYFSQQVLILAAVKLAVSMYYSTINEDGAESRLVIMRRLKQMGY